MGRANGACARCGRDAASNGDVGLLLLIGACWCATASAQNAPEETAATALDGATVESDPLRCWLKSRQAPVHVGEQFDAALTCAVVETVSAAVCPISARSSPRRCSSRRSRCCADAAIPTFKRGIWRYFQYEYTVRLVADGFFGQDLAIPPISINYRVNYAAGARRRKAASRTYVLPQLPIRVVRSSRPSRTTSAMRRATRSRTSRNGAWPPTRRMSSPRSSIAFAAVFVCSMAVRAFGTVRRGVPQSRTIDVRGSGGLRGLDALTRYLQRARRDGWTPALVDAKPWRSLASGLPLRSTGGWRKSPRRRTPLPKRGKCSSCAVLFRRRASCCRRR